MQAHDVEQRRAGAPSQPGTFGVGEVFGFAVRIHWTWLGAAALVTWFLAAEYLPSVHGDWSTGRYVAVGLATALLFFGAVVAHEVAHALVARRFGYRVTGITLFLLGGASALEDEPRTPRHEFWIAVVGPLTSLGLGAVSLAGWLAAREAGLAPVDAVLAYLALSNVAVALFNMIPAFPLDGGRVLRSATWAVVRSELRAMRIASVVGQALGLAMVGGGLLILLRGDALSGVWLAAIGWFVRDGARRSAAGLVVRRGLEGARVRQVMETAVPRVAPDLMLRDLVHGPAARAGHSRFFVSATADGPLFGAVGLHEMRRASSSDWATTPVYRAMTPRERLTVISADVAATTALALLASGETEMLVVLERGEPVGIVTGESLARAIELRALSGDEAA